MNRDVATSGTPGNAGAHLPAIFANGINTYYICQ